MTQELQEIELVYKGVLAQAGETYPEYDFCIRAALIYYYEFIPEIYLSEKDDDYQGSTFGIIKGTSYQEIDYDRDSKWFYFTFGWGSCSGCDMLEGSGPIETIKGLKNDIIPIPEGKTITEYIEKELDNSWSKITVEKLLEKWKNYMREHNLNDFGARK